MSNVELAVLSTYVENLFMFKDHREQWVLDTEFSRWTCLTPTIPGELLSADEVSDVVSEKGSWFASHSLKANSEPQSLWKCVQSIKHNIYLQCQYIVSANIFCFIKEF